MSASIEMPFSGTVTAQVLVNLRTGQPSITAPVLRKIPAGTAIAVAAVTSGDKVQGNSQWYKTADSAYVWSGACSPISTKASVATPQSPPVSGRAAKLRSIPMVVDISHGDGVTSFKEAKTAGVIGIIHKATTGATGRTEFYAERRQQALAAGLLWGAYHWGTSADVKAQVDNYLSYAAPDDQTLMALDFEPTVGNQMTLQDCIDFCQSIIDQTGRKAVIYSGSLIKENLGDTENAFLGSHKLWLAQYGTNPAVQKSWKAFWLWQYTDGISNAGPDVCTRVPGLPGDSYGHLDCNYFDGDAVRLTNEWAAAKAV